MTEPALTIDTIVHRVDRLPFTQLDDDLLALDADRGYVFSMNATSAEIWALFREPTAVKDACAALMREYSIDESTCRRDVLALLEQLRDAGLVEIHDGTSTADR